MLSKHMLIIDCQPMPNEKRNFANIYINAVVKQVSHKYVFSVPVKINQTNIK